MADGCDSVFSGWWDVMHTWVGGQKPGALGFTHLAGYFGLGAAEIRQPPVRGEDSEVGRTGRLGDCLGLYVLRCLWKWLDLCILWFGR